MKTPHWAEPRFGHQSRPSTNPPCVSFLPCRFLQLERRVREGRRGEDQPCRKSIHQKRCYHKDVVLFCFIEGMATIVTHICRSPGPTLSSLSQPSAQDGNQPSRGTGGRQALGEQSLDPTTRGQSSLITPACSSIIDAAWRVTCFIFGKREEEFLFSLKVCLFLCSSFFFLLIVLGFWSGGNSSIGHTKL